MISRHTNHTISSHTQLHPGYKPHWIKISPLLHVYVCQTIYLDVLSCGTRHLEKCRHGEGFLHSREQWTNLANCGKGVKWVTGDAHSAEEAQDDRRSLWAGPILTEIPHPCLMESSRMEWQKKHNVTKVMFPLPSWSGTHPMISDFFQKTKIWPAPRSNEIRYISD